MLRYASLENVRVLNGGFQAWEKAGGAIEAQERNYPAAQFKGDFKRVMFANKEEVQAAIDDPGVYIENSLTKDWDDDEHIPDSICLPLTELMIEWDAFLPHDQLVARLVGTGQDKRLITYCGGGIAATLNAIAHWMVGNENVVVNDGSLFEWMGEDLPVDCSQIRRA